LTYAVYVLGSLPIAARSRELKNQVGKMDNIANSLTIIRNGLMAKKETVKTPYSKVIFGIAEVLKKDGWIKDFELKEKGVRSFLIFTLKYEDNEAPAISGIARVSKPGKRIYASYNDIPVVRSGYGTTILSTPQGVISAQQAKKEKVGGELLCIVY